MGCHGGVPLRSPPAWREGLGEGLSAGTDLCRASPAASAGAKAGPHPASPASGGGGFGRLAAGLCRRFGAGVGFGHACLLLRGQGRDGMSLFCARFACAGVRARAGVGAGAVRAPDCARETAHAPRPFVPAGGFFGPQPVAFRRNAERRPREPPLSTFILHHTAKCQARPETKSETAGYFVRNPLRRRAPKLSWVPVNDRWYQARTGIGPASVRSGAPVEREGLQVGTL